MTRSENTATAGNGPLADEKKGRPAVGDLLLLLAAVLFGLAVRPGSMSGFAVVAAIMALGLSVWLSKQPTRQTSTDMETRILAGAFLFGILGLMGWSTSAMGPSSTSLERIPGLIWIALALVSFLLRNRRSGISYGAVAVATLTMVAVVGGAHIAAMDDLGIDVYHLHVQAAEAMADGANPWTDAVSVPNGSPAAQPGDMITGYVYPPATALGYAAGHWLTPDARYTSLIAWVAVLAIIGGSATMHLSARRLHVMLLLASVPGWWFVLRAAWTEPLSLVFIAIGFALWHRPTLAGLGIGSALASKQYFAVAAPLLLVQRDAGWVRRAVVAVTVVALTLGAAIVWDFGAFWDSAVAFHLSTPPRADSSNLVGLLSIAGVQWSPPGYLPIGLGLATAIWAGVRSARRRTFLLAMALSLSASFLVSSQAFANYWFLLFGLCGLALSDDFETDTVST